MTPSDAGPSDTELARGAPATPPSAEAVALGYEPHDWDAGEVARLLLLLAVSIAAAIAVMFLLIHGFIGEDRASQPRLTAEQTARVTPPLPQLQVTPFAELNAERGREAALLDGYAWLAPDHARARIPIGRAMTLTVGRSLDAGP